MLTNQRSPSLAHLIFFLNLMYLPACLLEGIFQFRGNSYTRAGLIVIKLKKNISLYTQHSVVRNRSAKACDPVPLIPAKAGRSL
jgi:hypothetical protein